MVELVVFFSSGSQCWYFSHEPSSFFHHSVLVDLSALKELVNHYTKHSKDYT